MVKSVYQRYFKDGFDLRPGAVNRLPPTWFKDFPRIVVEPKTVGMDPAKGPDRTYMGMPIREVASLDLADIESRMAAQMSTMFYGGRRGGKSFLSDLYTYGTAARYWPQEGDHQHMNDLTLSPAPKGGYTVLDYDDDVVFAGSLDECVQHMQDHFEEIEARKAREIEAKETEARKEIQVAHVRADADAAIRAIREAKAD